MMMKKLIIGGVALSYLSVGYAWSGHFLITYNALYNQNQTLNQKVKVESLDHFVYSLKDKLPNELSSIESFARANTFAYKELPSSLTFDPNNQNCAQNLTLCFKHAIRINPQVVLTTITYDPNNKLKGKLVEDISTLMIKPEVSHHTHLITDNQFKQVAIGDMVDELGVISASAEEPDFGLDVDLYQDSGTSFGKIYNFGEQPMHDKQVPYISQSLFHMSTYYLPWIFTAIYSPIKYSYPQYRFYQYMHLAKFAKQNGHPYWAARFSGWALHYLQDMTQPYHIDLFFGYSKLSVLYRYFVSSFISPKPFREMQTLISEKHIVNEDMAGYLLSNLDKDQFTAIPVKLYLAQENDNKQKCDIDNNFLINTVVPQTTNDSEGYENKIKKIFPQRLVDNPNGVDFAKVHYVEIYNNFSQEQKRKLLEMYRPFFQSVGWYTRSCIDKVLN